MPEAEYRLSPKAIDDLQAIWTYLAQRNERAADALLERIHARITAVLDFPLSGAPRPLLSMSARILLEDDYVIIYESADYGIYVIAITHVRKRPADWIEQERN